MRKMFPPFISRQPGKTGKKRFLFLSLFFWVSPQTYLWGDTKEGYQKAQEYFKGKQVHEEVAVPRASHMMSLHYAPFLEKKTYAWGIEETNKLHHSLGFTYRIHPSSHLWDFNLRAEMSFYKIENQKISKLSILPLITLPEVATAFPVYFGLGVGPGFFFEQIKEESYLSLDYQLFAGLRLINLWPHTGLFVEYGFKNSLHLLDDGQVNTVFMSFGGVFIF